MGSYVSSLIPQPDSEITVMPFKNKQIEAIAKKFLLSPHDMIFLHEIFRKMDKLGNGYISEENVFEFVEEEKTSVLSPYITRLFQLIEKENADRVCFVEWVPAICAFCLFTQEQILKFAFGMIDDDHDEVISKKDIIKFLIKERYGQRVFPVNQVRAIELLDVDRSDRIKFDQFKRIEQKIPFLCYPAFRLQAIFKEQIKGNVFWKKVFQSILRSEQEREKQSQQEIIDDQVNKKKNIEYMKKEMNFQQQTQNLKIEQNLFKENYLQNCQASLEDRSYRFYRSSSIRRYISPQNQECLYIDYKSVINPRRFSDGMVDISLIGGRQEDSRGKLDLPKLDYSRAKRVNSQLYVKQPFINAALISDKNEEVNNLFVSGSPKNSHIYGSPSHKLKIPQNMEVIVPQFSLKEQAQRTSKIAPIIEQQPKQMMRKIIPRSLKNTGAIDPRVQKLVGNILPELRLNSSNSKNDI